MKRIFSSAVLSLLLLLSLSACGRTPGGISSTEIHYLPESSSDMIVTPVPPEDPLLPPEEGSQGEENAPDSSQAPSNEDGGNEGGGKSGEGNRVEENGWYTSKEEVALYIHLYDRLPDNYVTKDEAQQAGWNGGNVERYTGEGTAIGGGYFGNREGLLPKEQGRSYTECDIDTPGENSRGAKRIVFSNDGLIYYTEDHYESFELLYGEP